MLFQINTPRIAHEPLDNEVIAIDFEDGTYYSIKGIGAAIWLMIELGFSSELIATRIQEMFQIQENSLNEIYDFIIQLEENELIIARNEKTSGLNIDIEMSELPTHYSAPRIAKHTDLQKLLLLDPIHEVDEEAGWPEPKGE